MKIFRMIASVVVVTAMLVVPASTVFAGFYPADRPTYTCITPDNCPGANHVTFDSFVNNPVVGDERPFLSGSMNSAPVQDRLQVKDGDTVVVRAYVHNNADATLMGGEANTVAKNVNFKLLVPTASQADSNLVGFISATNASPASINDTMSLYGDHNFTIEYVPGSAQFSSKPDGITQTTVALSDSIVTPAGASLGDMNGCFAYSGYVTLTVKIHMPTAPTPPAPVYTCNLLNVTQGDNRTVNASVTYTAQNGATFKAAKFNWGDNSSNLNNTPSGQHQYAVDGTYNINATVLFSVNGSDVSANSANCAKQVTISTATPPVTPVTPPTQLVNTGPGSVVGLFAGVTIAGAFAHRLFMSRKFARQ